MTFGGPNAATTIKQTDGGTIRVFDHPIRVGPEPNSRIIGRDQGTSTQAPRYEMANLIEAHYIFTSGEYNGSTLAKIQRSIIRENLTLVASIVAGTWQFLLAWGYIFIRPYRITRSSESQYIVLENTAYFRKYYVAPHIGLKSLCFLTNSHCKNTFLPENDEIYCYPES